MNSWWSFYPPGWFPHLRRALERRPRAVSGLSKAQCLPSAALGMGWNMLKPTVVPWWSWWTWTSKKMLVHVCSLYGIFIIVHSPKEICLRFWSIHSSLSLSCCDLLWLALQLASIAVLSADVGIAASDVSTFEADNWKPRRLLAIAHWLCGLEPVSPVDMILTTAKQQAGKFPTTTSKVNSSTHSWCSANDLTRMPFEHWQASRSSTTVHSSISGRFNGVDTNLAYPELT